MARRDLEDDRLPAITYGLLGVFAFGFILMATELPVVKYVGVVLAAVGLLGYALGRVGLDVRAAARWLRARRRARSEQTADPDVAE